MVQFITVTILHKYNKFWFHNKGNAGKRMFNVYIIAIGRKAYNSYNIITNKYAVNNIHQIITSHSFTHE